MSNRFMGLTDETSSSIVRMIFDACGLSQKIHNHACWRVGAAASGGCRQVLVHISWSGWVMRRSRAGLHQ